MIIKVKTETDIIWPAVALHVLQCYVVGAEMFVLACGVCIGIYLLAAGKLSIPKVPGLMLYLGAIAIATMVGFSTFSTNLVVKDLFYEISNIIPIILGYYAYSLYGKNKSMWKTVCFIALITAAMCFVQGIGTIAKGADFATLKETFGEQIISLGIVFPILVGKTFILHEITFSKVKDILVIILLAAQLLLSVSRTAIIIALVGFGIMFIAGNINKKLTANLVARTTALLVCMSVIGVIAWNSMPDTVTATLSDKFSKSFAEIDSSVEFLDTGDAQADWRGYEIYCAREQWKNNDVINQLIGEGNGSAILIKFVPAQFKDIVVKQGVGVGISLLHNTYYSLLVKGGILAVILFVYFFLANIVKGLRYIKQSNKEKQFLGMALVVICVGIMVGAYVVRSMFEKNVLLICVLLIGWINAELNDKKLEKKEKNGQ